MEGDMGHMCLTEPREDIKLEFIVLSNYLTN